MFEGRRLALSIEPREVRALVVVGQRIVRWEKAPLSEGTMRQGQIVQPQAFGEVVGRLIESVKAPRRRAVIGLSAYRSVIRILTLPPVAPRHLEETVHREARRELPLPVDGLYLSWQPIGDRAGGKLQVFTVGVPKEIVDTCMAGLRVARVRPVAMDLKPLALVRAANLPNVLLVDVEPGLATLVLVRDFIPQLVRSVALYEGEEELWLEQLVVAVQRVVEFATTTLAAGQPAWSIGLCLTGALATRPGVRARFDGLWSLVEPAPPISIPGDLPLLPYLGGIGLALKRLP